MSHSSPGLLLFSPAGVLRSNILPASHCKVRRCQSRIDTSLITVYPAMAPLASSGVARYTSRPITTPSSLTGTTAKYHPNDIVSVQWVSLDGIERTTRMQLGQGPARLVS